MHTSRSKAGAALDALLATRPALDAMLAYNDVIAIGALRHARAGGRRVPEDLAVIGIDGLAIGELVEPPLSTIRIDTHRLGTMAIEQVARMLDGGPSGLHDHQHAVAARLRLRFDAADSLDSLRRRSRHSGYARDRSRRS